MLRRVPARLLAASRAWPGPSNRAVLPIPILLEQQQQQQQQYREFASSTGHKKRKATTARSSAESTHATFYLNGERRDVSHLEPDTTLLQYVREHEGLTGSKLSCGEGGCGACTIMVSRWDRAAHRVTYACALSMTRS